ncbi:hypothetical protein IH981_02250, partial [Patescibacteria group bacterium]|nr:hypothetical protein [Patescibacteria group bacterium]
MDKSLFTQTGEIRGKKSTSASTFSFQFHPDDEELKLTRGDLFFLSQVKETDAKKADSFARSLYTIFKDTFYQAVGSNLKGMEEALEAVGEAIKQQGGSANIVAANLWGSVLYVARVGEAGVFLVRDEVTKKIEVSKVASGSLQDRDNVIIADSAFMSTADLSSLQKQISGSDFEESLKAVQESRQALEGNAFTIRLSIQEPIQATQEVLIADLDKLEKEHESQETKAKETTATTKKGFSLPKFEFSRSALEGKREASKKYLRKGWSMVNKYARKASFVILSPWLPREPGNLEEATLKKRQRIIQIVAVLAVILVISIGVGLINHTRNVNREKFETAITSIEGKLQDAQSLQDINPSQAKVFLNEAEEELEMLSSNDPKVESLQKKLDSLVAKINKIFKVELTNFADLTTLKGGIDTAELVIAGSSLFVLDKGTGSVYAVALSGEEPKILVSEKKGLQNIATSNEFTYLQTEDGLFKVDNITSVETKVSEASSDWKNLTAADIYRGNVYLLDESAKQIWKYVPATGGLGGPTAYFTQEFKNSPRSFAVDGAIWVVTRSEIFKFFTGKKDKFSVKEAPVRFSNITDIYTSEATTSLY